MVKLQHKNKVAAYVILKKLRADKCISYKTLQKTWCEARGLDYSWHHLPANYATTIKHLKDNGLMTEQKVNGFITYALTQKGLRCSFKTANVL